MKFSLVVLLSLLLAAAVFFLTSCGGSNGNPPPPPTITGVSISPSSAILNSGQTQQFSATVSGTSNYDATVSWYSCDSTGANCVKGGNTTYGTISSGMYTAPTLAAGSSPLSASVKATANGDSTKSATAAVTVNPPPVTQATLKWKDFEAMGSVTSTINGITLVSDSVVAVGTGDNSISNTGIAISYAASGKLANKYNDNSGDNGYAPAVTVGSSVMVGGVYNNSIANVALFTASLSKISNDFCPSTEFAGVTSAIAVNGSTVYLGITREPTAPPAIVLSDTNGNINCSSLTALQEDSSARIGSGGGVIAASDHIIVAGDSQSISPVVGWVQKLGLDFSLQAQHNFPNIIQPRAVEITESGSTFVYLVGTAFTGTTSNLIWVDKLDSNLNEVTGWPKTWDGDNPNFNGIAGNWGNAIVANPSSAGGVIAVGEITQLPPNTDPNAGDCGFIAYGPDGTVLWKTRQNFSVPVSCNAAVADKTSLSLYAGGSVNTNPQQTLAAKFLLPQ